MNSALLLSHLLDESTVQRIGWMLIHSLWQGCAAALVLAIALRVMRRARSQSVSKERSA